MHLKLFTTLAHPAWAMEHPMLSTKTRTNFRGPGSRSSTSTTAVEFRLVLLHNDRDFQMITDVEPALHLYGTR